MTNNKAQAQITVNPDAQTGDSPSRADIRFLFNERLITDSHFNAFCIDFYPAVYRQFSSSMNRTEKINLLLTMVDNTSQIRGDILAHSLSPQIRTNRINHLTLISIILTVLVIIAFSHYAITRAGSAKQASPAMPHPATLKPAQHYVQPIAEPIPAQPRNTTVDNSSKTYIHGNGQTNTININSPHGTIKQNITIK